jgi:hypothetical protein
MSYHVAGLVVRLRRGGDGLVQYQQACTVVFILQSEVRLSDHAVVPLSRLTSMVWRYILGSNISSRIKPDVVIIMCFGI